MPAVKPRRIEDYIFIAFIILGFVAALVTGSAIMYYIVSFLTGILFGRILYKKRQAIKFETYIMVTFFMIGFVLGNSITGYGDPRITIFVYFLGIVISYYLNAKQFFGIVDI